MLFEQVAWLIVIMINLHISVRSFFAYRDRGLRAKLYMAVHQEDYESIRLSVLIYGMLTTEAEEAAGEALASPTGKESDATSEMFNVVIVGWKSIEDEIIARMTTDETTNVPLRTIDKRVIASRHKQLRMFLQEADRVCRYLSILQVTDTHPPTK